MALNWQAKSVTNGPIWSHSCEENMKMLFAFLAINVFIGQAHAANVRQVELSEAVSLVHGGSEGELIALDGMNNSTNADVDLPNGQLRVTNATLVQIANALCDTATVRPAGGAGRVIYCIAK
jgi:hypothetical protein